MHTGMLTKEVAGTRRDGHELLARQTVPGPTWWAPLKAAVPHSVLLFPDANEENGRGWGHWPRNRECDETYQWVMATYWDYVTTCPKACVTVNKMK